MSPCAEIWDYLSLLVEASSQKVMAEAARSHRFDYIEDYKCEYQASEGHDSGIVTYVNCHPAMEWNTCVSEFSQAHRGELTADHQWTSETGPLTQAFNNASFVLKIFKDAFLCLSHEGFSYYDAGRSFTVSFIMETTKEKVVFAICTIWFSVLLYGKFVSVVYVPLMELGFNIFRTTESVVVADWRSVLWNVFKGVTYPVWYPFRVVGDSHREVRVTSAGYVSNLAVAVRYIAELDEPLKSSRTAVNEMAVPGNRAIVRDTKPYPAMNFIVAVSLDENNKPFQSQLLGVVTLVTMEGVSGGDPVWITARHVVDEALNYGTDVFVCPGYDRSNAAYPCLGVTFVLSGTKSDVVMFRTGQTTQMWQALMPGLKPMNTNMLRDAALTCYKATDKGGFYKFACSNSKPEYLAPMVFTHKCDTAPGTSGSPVIQDGKVVGVHRGALPGLTGEPMNYLEAIFNPKWLKPLEETYGWKDECKKPLPPNVYQANCLPFYIEESKEADYNRMYKQYMDGFSKYQDDADYSVRWSEKQERVIFGLKGSRYNIMSGRGQDAQDWALQADARDINRAAAYMDAKRAYEDQMEDEREAERYRKQQNDDSDRRTANFYNKKWESGPESLGIFLSKFGRSSREMKEKLVFKAMDQEKSEPVVDTVEVKSPTSTEAAEHLKSWCPPKRIVTQQTPVEDALRIFKEIIVDPEIEEQEKFRLFNEYLGGSGTLNAPVLSCSVAETRTATAKALRAEKNKDLVQGVPAKSKFRGVDYEKVAVIEAVEMSPQPKVDDLFVNEVLGGCIDFFAHLSVSVHQKFKKNAAYIKEIQKVTRDLSKLTAEYTKARQAIPQNPLKYGEIEQVYDYYLDILKLLGAVPDPDNEFGVRGVFKIEEKQKPLTQFETIKSMLKGTAIPEETIKYHISLSGLYADIKTYFTQHRLLTEEERAEHLNCQGDLTPLSKDQAQSQKKGALIDLRVAEKNGYSPSEVKVAESLPLDESRRVTHIPPQKPLNAETISSNQNDLTRKEKRAEFYKKRTLSGAISDISAKAVSFPPEGSQNQNQNPTDVPKSILKVSTTGYHPKGQGKPRQAPSRSKPEGFSSAKYSRPSVKNTS